MADNDISLNLRLDDKDFVVSIANSGKLLREFRQEMVKTANSVDKTERHFNSFTGHFKSFMMTVAATRFALMDINDVFLALPRSVLKASGEIERMTKLMSGLSKETDELKQAQEGLANTKFVFKMAQNAPFEVSALSDAFVKLKVAGLDPTDGSLNTLADSIARFGGSSQHLHRASIAIQQMTGKGVISMEELRQQLGEAMPNAMRAMALGTGMSMAELTDKVSKGTVEAKSALERMFAVLRVQNDGAALAMMDTYIGQLEKLKTNWMLLLNDIGNSGGFLREVTKQLKDLNDAFTSEELRTFAHTVSTALADATKGVADLVRTVQKYSGEIAFAGQALIAVWGGSKLLSILNAVGAAYAAFSARYIAGMGSIISAERTKAAASTANAVEEINSQRRSIIAAGVANAEKIRLSGAAAAAELAQNRAKHVALEAEEAAYRAKFEAADKVATTRRLASGKFASAAEQANQKALATAYFERAMAAERMAVQIQAAEAGLLATSTGTMGAMRANTLATQAAMAGLGTATVVTASKMTMLQGAVGLLGGPIGVIITLLTAGTFAWFEWGRSAQEAANRAGDALKRAKDGYATLEDVATITKRIADLQESIAKKELQLKGTGVNKKPVQDELDALKKELSEHKKELGSATKQGNESAIQNTVRIVEDRAKAEINAEKRASSLKANAAMAALEEEFKSKKVTKEQFEKKQSAVVREQAVANANAEVAAYRKQLANVNAEIAKVNAGQSEFKPGGVGEAGFKAQAAAIGESLRTSEIALAHAMNIGTDPDFAKKKKEGLNRSPLDSMLESEKAKVAELNEHFKNLLNEVDGIDGLRAEINAKVDAMVDGGKFKHTVDGKTVDDGRDAAKVQQLKDAMLSEAVKSKAKPIYDDLQKRAAELQATVLESNAAMTGGVREGSSLDSINKWLLSLESAKNSAAMEYIRAELARTGESFEQFGNRMRSNAAIVDIEKFAFPLKEKTNEINASLVDSERERHEAQYRVQIDAYGKKFAAYEEAVKKEIGTQEGADARLKDSRTTFYAHMKALADKHARDMETPLQKMARNWEDVTKTMRDHSTKWGDGLVDVITQAAITGRLEWKKWLAGMLTDILNSRIKQQFGGIIGKSLDGVIDFFGGIFNGGSKPVGPTQDGGNLADNPISSMFKSVTTSLGGFWNSIVGASDVTKGLTINMGETVAKGAEQLAGMAVEMTAEQQATASLLALAAAASAAAGAMGGNSAMGLLGAAQAGGYQLGTGMLGNAWANMNGFESLDHAGEAAAIIDAFADGGIMSSAGKLPLNFYSNGGVANSPQMALFGEGRMNEAFVPLPDGRSIPVTMSGLSGGTNNNVTIQINVSRDGSATTDTKGDGDDRATWSRMAQRVQAVVREELVANQRPGGLLYK